jgi:hypothetical protein
MEIELPDNEEDSLGVVPDERKSAIDAVRAIVEPLCVFMVRNGVGYREAHELLRDGLVAALEREEFSVNNKSPSVSRSSVLSGLSRKEIAKRKGRRGNVSREDRGVSIMSLPARLLSIWANDRRFQDENGEPAALCHPVGAPSFVDLLRVASADVPPTAVIAELVRCGSIVWEGESALRMVRQSYRPLASDDYSSVRFGECVRDLQNTLLANMNSGPKQVRLLERRAWTGHLPVGSLEHFHGLVERLSETLLKEADSWLTLADASVGERSSPEICGIDTTRAGVGIYVFQDS